MDIMENIAVLDKVLPVVVRVHGKEHPELKEIQQVYGILREKVSGKEDAGAEIARMRELTNNYVLPEGACQAYEKVYHSLQQIDENM